MFLDDDEDLRLLVEMAFRKAGHTLMGAANVQQALQLVSTNVFDFLIIDMNLLGMSGIEAINEIRKSGCQSPVIIFSGGMEPSNSEDLQSLGVIRIMEKTHNQKNLVDYIESLMRYGIK